MGSRSEGNGLGGCWLKRPRGGVMNIRGSGLPGAGLEFQERDPASKGGWTGGRIRAQLAGRKALS